MSLIGFLVNIREGLPPTRDFSLFRIAAIDEELRKLGAQLFIYSPRQIDPNSGKVTGLLIENGQFISSTAPVPEVNGSWYIGRDKSSRPGMGALQFRNWTADNSIEIYPQQSFSKVLKDKLKTSRMIRDFNPALHPHTEAYDRSLEQLTRFVQRYKIVFVKPCFGSKGDDIISIWRTKRGLRCAYYTARQKQEIIYTTAADALAAFNKSIGSKRFVIQQGIAIDQYNNAPFIFRVIMLDDGKQWQWVHKAVLAAPGSDVANTTQGGSNWKIVDLLEEIYGVSQAGDLFAELKRVSFESVNYLDSLFPGKLMEVAFDFVLNRRQQLKILEINTLPGMTKPGLPPEPAFSDILNRQPSEQETYEKFVVPHCSCLARFLHTKLQERQARSLPSGAHSIVLNASQVNKNEPTSDTWQSDTDVDPVESLLDQTINRQARHLILSCLADGSFPKRYNASIKVGVDPRFDALTQVGVIYALDQYDRWRPNNEAREAMQRAGEYLKANYIAPIPGEEHLLAIWSRSEFNQEGIPDQIRLGWVGLGLVALLCLERQNPGFTSLDELRALGEFLLWGQNEDGSFQSLFLPNQEGWKQGWKSLNYPGEAAFALLMLHELDPSPRWVQAAAEGIAYLVQSRENETDVPADYWMLLATARLLPVYHKCNVNLSRKSLIRHARQVCESILNQQVRTSRKPTMIGGFDPGGRTEPTATRLQGLLAARTFMNKEDPDFDERLGLAARDGINFLIRACIPDGSKVTAMPRSNRPLFKGGTRVSQTLKNRAAKVRLDDVQHALSALIQYA